MTKTIELRSTDSSYPYYPGWGTLPSSEARLRDGKICGISISPDCIAFASQPGDTYMVHPGGPYATWMLVKASEDEIEQIRRRAEEDQGPGGIYWESRKVSGHVQRLFVDGGDPAPVDD